MYFYVFLRIYNYLWRIFIGKLKYILVEDSVVFFGEVFLLELLWWFFFFFILNLRWFLEGNKDRNDFFFILFFVMDLLNFREYFVVIEVEFKRIWSK